MNTSLLKLGIVSAIMFTLSACGGGGGSDSSNNSGGGTLPPPVSYTVTASAGTGGSISPASRSVVSGQTTTFSVSANEGYNINQVTGCNGSLSGSTYTTGAITSACSVSASFSLKTYTVTATAGEGGSITPESATVNHGDTTEFTITPNSGFGIESVTGCEGSLEGNTYTTGSITGACSVEAEFTELSGVAAALQFNIAGGVALQTLASGVVSVQGQAADTMSSTAIGNQSTLFNYQRVMGSPDAADFSATTDRLLSESNIPSNLLVLDENGNLRLAIDATLPIKVMYTVADPSGENVYVALSRDWQDGIDYSHSIAELNCGLIKVSVADNELSCVAEGVVVQEMNDNYLQTISNNNKPLLFSNNGTLYFGGREFVRDDRCLENPNDHCYIRSESVLFVYSVATDGTVTKLTNDLMNVESFQVLADGQLVIYGWNEASGQQELNLVNDGQTLRISQTWGVEFFTVDDDRTVVFGDYSDRNIRLARPREAGGMERTSLSTALFSELTGNSHPVRVITGDDGRVYGVFNAWRGDYNADTEQWESRNFLSVYQMLPYSGTPIAELELQDGNWWSWMQRTPFQINKGHLYYVATVDVPFFGRSDVLKMVNIETRTTTTLLNDFDTNRYQFHNWRLSGDTLYFSAQNLTRSVSVYGEVDTLAVRNGASMSEFLTLNDVASARGAAVAIQDIEILKPQQPLVDTGSNPRATFYVAPENRYSASIDFNKYMNRKSVTDNLSFTASDSEAAIPFLPVWFYQTLHLIPDTSAEGLGDSVARGLEKDTNYTIALANGVRDAWDWDLTGTRSSNFTTLGDEFFQVANNSSASQYPSNASAVLRFVAPSGKRAKVPATIDFNNGLNDFEFSFTMARHGDQAQIALADNETEWLKITNEGWRLRVQFMQASGPREFYSYIPNDFNDSRWLDFKILKQGSTLQVLYGRHGSELELINWWWENDTDSVTTFTDVVLNPSDLSDFGIYVTTGFNNNVVLANVAFTDISNTATPRVLFNSNQWLNGESNLYFSVNLLPRQELTFQSLEIERRESGAVTRTRVQVATGRTYRYFHERGTGQSVRAEWPIWSENPCEVTVTAEYIDYTIPSVNAWQCQSLTVYVEDAAAAAKPTAFVQDSGVVVEFVDQFTAVNNITQTVVVSTNANITASNFSDSGNILANNAESPQTITGLQNGSTYYVAIATDFFGEITMISEVVAVTPQPPAANLKFHVADAQTFVLLDRALQAYPVASSVSSQNAGSNYQVNRAAKETNFMKITSSGEFVPVIESRDYSFVQNAIITPDNRSLIVSLGRSMDLDGNIGWWQFKTIIARNNCAIFKVDLQTEAHECLASGWIDNSNSPLSRWAAPMGLSNNRSFISLSPEIENGVWAGVAYLYANPYTVSGCSDAALECNIQRDFSDPSLIATNSAATRLVAERFGGVQGYFHAIDSNHVLTRVNEQDRSQPNRLVLFQGDQQRRNIAGGNAGKAVAGRAGQYAYTTGTNRLYITNYTSTSQQETWLPLAWPTIDSLYATSKGELLALTGSRVANQLLPGNMETFNLQVMQDNISNWSGNMRSRNALVVINDDAFYVEELDDSGVWPRQVITHVNRATDVRTVLYGASPAVEMRILNFAGQDSVLWWAEQTADLRTRLVKLDLSNIDPNDGFTPTSVAQALEYIDTDIAIRGLDVAHVLPVPQPASYVGSDFALEVLVDTVHARTISLVFNQPVNKASVENAIELVNPNGEVAISYLSLWVNNTLHLVPDRRADLNISDTSDPLPLEFAVDYELRLAIGSIANAQGDILDMANNSNAPTGVFTINVPAPL